MIQNAPLKTALVVGISYFHQRAMKQTLMKAGLERVIFAEDGRGAVLVLGEELISVVLTPWELPDFSGKKLLASLANRGRNGKVPVILLDDGLPSETLVAAVKAGISGRVKGTPDTEELREVLGHM